MVKLLHWCALRISTLGEVIFNLGGNLELWCDTIIYERERRARIAQWQRYVDEYAGKPIITMLDEWEDK
jgi:hypothetical protein